MLFIGTTELLFKIADIFPFILSKNFPWFEEINSYLINFFNFTENAKIFIKIIEYFYKIEASSA